MRIIIEASDSDTIKMSRGDRTLYVTHMYSCTEAFFMYEGEIRIVFAVIRSNNTMVHKIFDRLVVDIITGAEGFNFWDIDIANVKCTRDMSTKKQLETVAQIAYRNIEKET